MVYICSIGRVFTFGYARIWQMTTPRLLSYYYMSAVALSLCRVFSLHSRQQSACDNSSNQPTLGVYFGSGFTHEEDACVGRVLARALITAADIRVLATRSIAAAAATAVVVVAAFLRFSADNYFPPFLIGFA